MGLLKKNIKVIILLLIFVAVSITLGSIPSDTLISFVGSNNAFVLMLVLGTIGGLTTFTGIPYHFILMSFAAGGVNPVLLGLATAVGVMVGDSTMFLLSKKVKDSLSPKVLEIVNHASIHLSKNPSLITPALVLYGTFSPFSNDFIVASMSLMGYSFRRIIVPLAIGNILFNIGLAYLGLYYYDSVVGLFGI